MATSPFDVTFQVGRVTQVEPFSEARKPKLCKLWIDLGEQSVQSAAQLLYHYTPEALVVGVPGADGHPVLVQPDPSKEVPLGGRLY